MTGFTEGVYIDEQSTEWNNESIFDIVKELNGDPQLIDIEGQARKKDLRECRQPDDIFPNSIIIVRENVLKSIFEHFKTLMGGHYFPTRACLTVLKEQGTSEIPSQIKRDIGANPEKPSTCRELKIIIKSHLNMMDPCADEGVRNLVKFEEEVCKVSKSNYNIVPEHLRDRC